MLGVNVHLVMVYYHEFWGRLELYCAGSRDCATLNFEIIRPFDEDAHLNVYGCDGGIWFSLEGEFWQVKKYRLLSTDQQMICILLQCAVKPTMDVLYDTYLKFLHKEGELESARRPHDHGVQDKIEYAKPAAFVKRLLGINRGTASQGGSEQDTSDSG